MANIKAHAITVLSITGVILFILGYIHYPNIVISFVAFVFAIFIYFMVYAVVVDIFFEDP